jgi:selT/selW/selH-like putative selenoprotein
LAEALVVAFKPLLNKPHPIESVTLIPGSNGRFEVMIDGALVYSKAATGKHTTNDYIIEQVRTRLKQR